MDDDVHRRAGTKAAERGTSVSAAVRKIEFDRRKRLQHEALRGVDTFSAGDRLPREEIHRRGRLHGMNFAGVAVRDPFA